MFILSRRPPFLCYRAFLETEHQGAIPAWVNITDRHWFVCVCVLGRCCHDTCMTRHHYQHTAWLTLGSWATTTEPTFMTDHGHTCTSNHFPSGLSSTLLSVYLGIEQHPGWVAAPFRPHVSCWPPGGPRRSVPPPSVLATFPATAAALQRPQLFGLENRSRCGLPFSRLSFIYVREEIADKYDI